MVVFVIIVLVSYMAKNRNKETIIDLGNGWRSYANENLRFTVKIPEDAEIEAGTAGNKNEQFIARFSKGDIKYVRAYHSGNRDNPDDVTVVNRSFKSYCENWEYKPGANKYKTWCEKVEINGKSVIVRFRESVSRDENEMNLQIDDPEILGKRKTYHISLRKEITTHTEQRTKEHQNFTQEEVDDFIKEKTQLIKSLVIAVSNY